MIRHFLEIADLDRSQLLGLLERARRLKAGEVDRSLQGKTLALIFRKSSTRTRVSFEVGIRQLGGTGIFLADRDTQLGRGEPVMDTARVLSRYVDGIMIRTFEHAEVEALAKYAEVPVINGLTDRFHPCQLLADLQTVQEEFGPELSDLRIAWVGDGNNMAHSWLNAALLLGFELRVATPEGFEPDPELVRRARTGADVVLTTDPAEAVEGAHVVNTDVWASMGQEEEVGDRVAAFEGYRITAELMAGADPEAIFLHCLPAHRGEEVTAEVIDGPRSRIYREAENRLHAQKALLVELFSNPD